MNKAERITGAAELFRRGQVIMPARAWQECDDLPAHTYYDRLYELRDGYIRSLCDEMTCCDAADLRMVHFQPAPGDPDYRFGVHRDCAEHGTVSAIVVETNEITRAGGSFVRWKTQPSTADRPRINE